MNELARDWYLPSDSALLEEIIDITKSQKEQQCHIDSAIYDKMIALLEKQSTIIKDTISMNINSETEWDDIYKFLRMNLNGEKVKLLIIREK